MKNSEQFWDTQHEKDEVFWLTGTLPQTILDLHKLPDLPHTVMEIGVGQGQFIRHLFKEEREIFAVDVSQNALDKLDHFIDRSVLTKDLPLIPSDCVDLAVCHLVFQHCEDSEVEFIIKEVHRTLKPGGLFSFQIAGHQGLDKLDDFHREGVKNETHFFRNQDKVMSMCSGLNPQIVNGMYFPQQGYVEWYIVHIKK